MKYLMIAPGLCVQPEKDKTDFEFCWSDYIASLPKLPTTCTLPAGKLFDGEEGHQVFSDHCKRCGEIWETVDKETYNKAFDHPKFRRTIIVPVEQKDEAPKDEPVKQDGWRNYIKQFPKLEEIWNKIGEPTNLYLSQQIDVYAGQSLKQSDAVEFAEWVKKHCSWVARNGNWGWATDLAEFPGLYTIPELYKLFTLK